MKFTRDYDVFLANPENPELQPVYEYIGDMALEVSSDVHGWLWDELPAITKDVVVRVTIEVMEKK